MSQSYSEIVKEIVIAAMENGYISKESYPTHSVEECNEINAREITKFIHAINQAIVG